MWRIEQVQSRCRDEAIRFLAGVSACDAASRAGAETLRDWASAYRPDAVRLWWACQGATPLAAAMIVKSPGRIGMLIHSAASEPGVDGDALTELIRAVTREAIDDEMTMMQLLLEPDQAEDIAVVEAAGYFLLAELIYMKLDLRNVLSADAGGVELTWRNYGQFTEAELGEVISATYRLSRDCPAIAGLRDIADIIETHKNSGIFRPESWWIAECDGSPAGVILINDCKTQGISEVIYIGVVPQYRGKGLSRTLLCRAAKDARLRNQVSLQLAVDTRNNYALNVYYDIGFTETHRRLAYVAVRKRGK